MKRHIFFPPSLGHCGVMLLGMWKCSMLVSKKKKKTQEIGGRKEKSRRILLEMPLRPRGLFAVLFPQHARPTSALLDAG